MLKINGELIIVFMCFVLLSCISTIISNIFSYINTWFLTKDYQKLNIDLEFKRNFIAIDIAVGNSAVIKMYWIVLGLLVVLSEFYRK